MSVVIETTLGDLTIDLFIKERPRACLNFLKLCKIKYYNYNLFHTISRNFIAQTGDPTGTRNGGESIFGVLEGPLKRYFEPEKQPRIKHTNMGLISFVGNEDCMLGSQFFLTLGTELTYLDEQHCVFGEVIEGLDVLEILNDAICDDDNRPYKDIRITHTVILDDPLPDPKNLHIPERSPSPSAERLQGGRIAPDEEIDETVGKSMQEIVELQAEREAKARATILEMVGDIPDAEMAPPENVLFVCKLNPVTTDDDLEIIFSRFGKIKSCEVIRDKKSGDSLQYAFVEFDEQKACENAYFKMDNVLIDDRRIHVDFSQSVAKIKWHGKGRGVTTYDDKGRKTNNPSDDFGNGRYSKEKSNKDSGEYKSRRDYHRNSNSQKADHYYPKRDYRGDQYKTFAQPYDNSSRHYSSNNYYSNKRRNYDQYDRNVSNGRRYKDDRITNRRYDRHRDQSRYSSESENEKHRKKKSKSSKKKSETEDDSSDYETHRKKKKNKRENSDDETSSNEKKNKKKKKKRKHSESENDTNSSEEDKRKKSSKKKKKRDRD